MTDRHEATFTWPYVGPSNVIVTGTFDGWSKSIPLTKGPDGHFSARVPLNWGEKVQYKYVVDGYWATDAEHPTELDGRGNVNHIYVVPPQPPRVVTTADVPKPASETIPAPPADAISAPLDPLPAVTPPVKQTIYDQAKDTVIASEGAKTSIGGYLASGLGSAIHSVTGVDPINPRQIPVDASPVPDSSIPSTIVPPSVTPLIQAVTKSVVATASEALSSAGKSPIVAAVTKPVVAVLPAVTVVETPPIDAAPIVFEEAKKDVAAVVPEVLKDAQEKAQDQACQHAFDDAKKQEKAHDQAIVDIVTAPKLDEACKKAFDDNLQQQKHEVDEIIDIVTASSFPSPPAVDTTPIVIEEAKKDIETLPAVLEDAQAKAKVDIPSPPPAAALPAVLEDAQAKAKADIPSLPPVAALPTPITPPAPAIVTPATPTKHDRSASSTTATPSKERPATPTTPTRTSGSIRKPGFLSRQSSEMTSPGKASIKSNKDEHGRKRKTSFISKLKHLFDGDKEKKHSSPEKHK